MLSWVIIAATILFAYLDYRELKKRGIPQPFHWGFAFLALAGFGIVYPIGRAVVTNRRGAGGLVVMWIAIAHRRARAHHRHRLGRRALQHDDAVGADHHPDQLDPLR